MAGLVPQVLNEANYHSFLSAFGSLKYWLETGFDEQVVMHGVADADKHSPHGWNFTRLCFSKFFTGAHGTSFVACGIKQ